jgi:uncharacterized protein YbbC (DUF1343 family)
VRAKVIGLTLGLEAALTDPPSLLRDKRFGLLVNQASVDPQLRYAHSLLANRFSGRLAALFTPQHGLWSEQQDNMVESPHGTEPRLAIPIHSLYSETRKPSPEMLRDLELFVVDLQDVGCRVYTYIWTVSHCLEACAALDIPVMVLDRPNPLGGEAAEGPLLDPDFSSFVGRAPIPMRHGLTMGEMTLCLNELMGIGAEVEVVRMNGWQRSMLWPETRRAWVPPSPNLPRIEAALVYPGQVLLEGTNLSEGRGTTTPFELFGAPWLDPHRLLAALDPIDMPGVTLRPLRFCPGFHKFQGQSCGGLFLHVTDPGNYRPYATTLALLAAISELWPGEFQLRGPPYEYETEKMPLDMLTGGDAVRQALDGGTLRSKLDKLSATEPSWWEIAQPHLLYPSDIDSQSPGRRL